MSRRSRDKKARLAAAQDEYGRTLTPAESASPDTRPLLIGGLEDTKRRGFTEKLSIEAVARVLRAAEEGDLAGQMALFEEMEERDSRLHAAMMTRRGAPYGLGRIVVPARLRPLNGKPVSKADEDLAKEIAEEVEEVLNGITGEWDWLIDLFDAIGKGLSVLQIMWRPDASIEAIQHVHPTRLEFDAQPGPTRGALFINTEDERGTPIRRYIRDYPNKFIVHRCKMRSGHASRAGELRPVVWPYVFRNYGLRDWSVFCEIFGMPMRVGKYSAAATKEDKAVLAEMLQKMASDAWAVISDKTVIEFIESVQRGMEPFSAFYKAMGSEYFFGLLGQDQTNQHNDAGGRTQVTEGGAKVRQDIMEFDSRQGQGTIKRDLIRPIVELRRGAEIAKRFTPMLKFAYEPQIDRLNEAQADKIVLVDMGVGKRVRIVDVAEKYGWALAPDDTPEEDLLDPPTPAAPVPPGGDPNAQPQGKDGKGGKGKDSKGKKDDAKKLAREMVDTMLARKFRDKGSPEQKRLDRFVDGGLERAGAAMESLVAPLQALLVESDDMVDLRNRLESAYADLDTEEFEQMLVRLMLVAELYGRATIVEETPEGR